MDYVNGILIKMWKYCIRPNGKQKYSSLNSINVLKISNCNCIHFNLQPSGVKMRNRGY